jgi:outer membrane protein assembly factor BamB
VFVVLAGVAGFLLMRRSSSVTVPVVTTATAVAPMPAPGVTTLPMEWEGVHAPILTDVNGDKVPDVVGRVRYILGGDTISLAAFEGATGKPLWESARVGSHSATFQGLLGLADDALLLCKTSGEMTAWGLHDGKKRWTKGLPDKAKHLCKGDHPGEVHVVLADDTVVTVRLADGHASAPTPALKGASHCSPLATDGADDGDPNVETHRLFGEDARVEGMQGTLTLQRSGGPRIVLGYRAKGTRVPMIAGVYPSPAQNWKSDVPGARLLETTSGPESLGALGGSRVFTEYGFSSGGMTPHQLVAFDVTGHRLWETPLPSGDPLTAIRADEQRVFVSQWGQLSVWDGASGKALYTIGKR